MIKVTELDEGNKSEVEAFGNKIVVNNKLDKTTVGILVEVLNVLYVSSNDSNKENSSVD